MRIDFAKKKLGKILCHAYQISILVVPISGAFNVSEALSISEDFTGTKTNNAWLMPSPGSYLTTPKSNSACLTAGSQSVKPTATTSGSPPRCSMGNDDEGKGALRLTRNAGWLVGGVVSDFSFPTNDGVDITFTTYTFGGDGADGMAFMLLDASKPVILGATGGSLGYSCTNQHGNESGVIGGYLGIGIDEYGNFLNAADNTNTGAGGISSSSTLWPNSIGIRGAGSISYDYFADPKQFLQDVWTRNQWGTVPNHIAEQWKNYWSSISHNWKMTEICRGGSFTVPANYTLNGQDIRMWAKNPMQPANQQPDERHIIYNYPYLAHMKLTHRLDTPFVSSRSQAKPITYKIKITPAGRLSVWVGYNGGTYQPIILDEDILSKNGPLPPAFRFGFAASTGGSNNNHDVTCFKATPADISEGSAASNLPNETFKTGAQIYSALYNSLYWTGHLIAQSIDIDKKTGKALIQPLANWDAGCNLTGGECANTGSSVKAQSTSERSFWSWDGYRGMTLAWDSLSNVQKASLRLPTELDDTLAKARLEFIKGNRSDETPNGILRARSDVLADIINSSPLWVGYPDTKSNKNYTSYNTFVQQYQQRTNVVYVGANDGFLHAFRSGSYDLSGNFVATHNDGKELFAYMPSKVLARMNRPNDASLNYSNPQYAHNFYVDATPAMGEVFYSGSWHNWLMGGLGAGGNTMYVLDITDPDHFSASNVKGEWSYAKDTIWQYLGNTYGTPEFGRFHNGQWGAVFGNGWCTTADEENGNCTAVSGPAGVYVMTINQNTGVPSFQFLSTDSAGTKENPNGIAYATPYDVNNDGIIDYIYAGDLKGQIWRFNLNDATNWQQTKPQLIFKAVDANGKAQPISTKILVSKRTHDEIILNFGTGLKQEGYLVNENTYANGTQSIYGLKDTIALEHTSVTTPVSHTTDAKIVKNQLLQQTVNQNTNAISQNQMDWTQFSGWYLDLPAVKSGDNTNYEQIIWSPYLKDGALVVNTSLQSNNAVVSCETALSTGYTYALKNSSGAGLPHFWQSSSLLQGSYRQQLGASGTNQILWINGQHYLLVKDRTGHISIEAIHLSDPIFLKRLSWREIADRYKGTI